MDYFLLQTVDLVLHKSMREDEWRRLSDKTRNDRYLPDHQFRISTHVHPAQLHIVFPSRRPLRKFYRTFTVQQPLRDTYSLTREKNLLFRWGPLTKSEKYVDCCAPRSFTSYAKQGTSTMKKSLCLLQRLFLHAPRKGSSPWANLMIWLGSRSQ